ncbi:hypothetical protein C8F04DRAFT_1229792 [Mycena alexandri]|uniref:Uncharacterized protein n=1 Tax=Mycena alexandri TaxID=1745969 RepID=A0AAD6XC35_9AGAR|nr:hypothetical protein C8F04DRAFT_1229792 [Mycena alexandri]
MPANDAQGNPLQLDLPPAPSPADVLSLPASEPPSQDQPSEQETTSPKPPCRPLLVYTRPQMLHLQSSPLVKSPPAMPELKDWFGRDRDHESSPNKKDTEPTTPNSARERRFRRDADDGETSTRPTFRSTLSQPSQMGNFKHQSLRDRDRDRDRDGDKDRERDIRDKEGQERLRNLSDKYDRDRLAAPGLRNKERDIAPHLAIDAAIRGSAPLSAAARRAEARDGAKKKVGEVSEDWRRGSHVTRQERYENSRATREDRDRPRDRDSSRSRRDVSSSRRDRDGEDKESAGDRRDDRKPARDDRRTREDHRRERDERRERERDVDRDAEKDDVEDSRRWRDDGKRDERMAARRQAEKGSQENGDASGDRRWTVVEDRDGRSKRNHRDRRAGGTAEDGKEREDRRDREREKEPAWMDTYIPESPGILGSKGGEGELDGIQAWKKGLKEKEKEKEKEKTASVPPPQKDEERTAASESKPENPMDEIQIFRMLMKQAESKPVQQPATDISAPPGIRARAPQGPLSAQTSESTTIVAESTSNAPSLPNAVPSAQPATPVPITAPTPPASSPANNATSLLSILGKAEPTTRPSPLNNPASGVDAPPSSRFFPKPINHNTAPTAEKPVVSDPPPQPAAQFNPPPGSRLLAFGARPAGKSPGPPPPSNGLNNPINQQDSTSQHTGNSGPLDLPLNHGPPKSDNLRAGFSPFEEQSRMSFAFEEQREREQGAFSRAEPMRRGDQVPYGLPSEAGSYVDSAFDPSSTGYPTGKGSRLAKFFDSKGREAQGNQNSVGFTSPSPNPGPRHDGGYNPMDGLLSKLNNSAQIQRPNMMSPNSAPSAAGVPFGPQAQNNLQILQQQQQQHQQHNQPQHLHLHPNNRLDSLYESRLDDRNFVPDGMVPGLRSVPPPRARDGLYSDSIEDSIHFNPQRLPPQHHRGLDPMYNPVPSVFSQQGGRNAGIPIQPQYRGAPSPISNPQQQRLPPGLANLGGRPPLEGSQFMGMPGLPSAGLHGGLHNGPPQQQQQFNNFAVNGNLNYGAPQMRVPPSSAHQLQGSLPHHQLANLGHPNIDLRAANQAQLLNLGGNGIRGIGMGGFTPQQGPPAQMQQQPLHALRQQEQQRQQQLHQQQQQQLPPHMMSHHHIQVGHPHQQQGLAQPNNNPPDLMALLMGGTAHHRD